MRRARRIRLSLLALALATLALPASRAATIYVDASHLGDEQGTQALPYNSIREGLVAAVSGDVVQVASGIYRETISMKDGVSVIGAGATSTIIDGSGTQNSVVRFDGTRENPRLSGFTITGGEGDLVGDVGGILVKVGGGIRIEGSSPVISNNIITGNVIDIGYARGAGIYVDNLLEDPQIFDNVISYNIARSDDQPTDLSAGGGIYLSQKSGTTIFSDNQVIANEAHQGAGMFIRNTASSFGSIQRNVFRDNIGEIGAALFTRELTGSRSSIINNMLIGNGSRAGVRDCDDTSATVNPGQLELCNDGIDNDCDDSTPDVFDRDSDGFSCEIECNDDDPLVNPSGAEKCDDGIDNDCDGDIDGADSDCACADGDGDGYACADCVDTDININPAQAEVCSDGIDNDCNPATVDVFDGDGDGFNCAIDCVDNDPTISPGADEISCDGIDNDCNPGSPDVTDEDMDGFSCEQECDDLAVAINPNAIEFCFDNIDNNCDGFIDNNDEECSCNSPVDLDLDGYRCLDCNDGNITINPGAQEVCNDGIDNDCDPLTPDLFDADGDGFDCVADCAPTDPSVSPNAFEICNDGIDNDCDGDTDLADTDCSCPDLDGDGYACSDCRDDDITIHPDAAEVCNDGEDNDCNALTTDIFDEDEDGFDCTTDCDDRSPLSRPGIGENCNDFRDNNCNGLIDFNRPDEQLVGFGRPMVWIANTTDPGVGLSWVDPFFDDETWRPGLYGVGYEAGVGGAQSLIASNVPLDSFSVYTRARFGIADLSGVNALFIAADYDDAWVAWINGVEVYRSPEMPGGTPAWNTDAALHESSNGVVPDFGIPIDISVAGIPLLQVGNNVLAVGVWNSAPSGGGLSSDLVVVPRLSMDYGDDDADCACPDLDEDGYACSDCDDTDPDVSPGQIEIGCDFTDNDCDVSTDDITDVDEDGADCTADCDDLDSLRSPNFNETLCDGIDNDCNESTFDDDDDDNDGFDCYEDCNDDVSSINPGEEEIPCDGLDNDCKPGTPDVDDIDGDGSFCDLDCDDSDPTIGPDAAEKCDDNDDNDCDGLTDGDDDDCACPDVDLDGYACDDCVDGNSGINPGAVEVCNDGIDNDCDPSTPDIVDADGDGVTCDLDCDDTNRFVRPNGTELCNDGIDNDCDPGTPDIFDADSDGITCDIDCNDSSATVAPNRPELCNDGIDNDCDPLTLDVFDNDSDGFDCTFDCNDSVVAINPGVQEICNDGIDNDCSGATVDLFDIDEDGTTCDLDCDDADPTRSLDASEQCVDGLDNDCDGLTDAADPDCGCPDLDGDFYSCSDCDDTLAAVNPGAPEVCADAVDNDCNPATQDVDDLDGDGSACDLDCNDADPSIYPGAPEVCNDAIDNDCNAGTPDIFDADSDTVFCDLDCNDGDPSVNPNVTEVSCDGVDNDCDPMSSDIADADGDLVFCADLSQKGGAIASEVVGSGSIFILHNTIIFNTVDAGTGGAIWVDDFGSAGPNVVANNIVTDNAAALGGGFDGTRFYGSVLSNGFFGNQGGDLFNAGGGAFSDVGNLAVDPLYIAPGIGNYRLKKGSPMIDSALPEYSPVLDLESFPRPLDGDEDGLAVADRGAFEFPSAEVVQLLFLDRDTITWSVQPTDIGYNLYRGTLTRLRTNGSYTQSPAFADTGRFCDIPPSQVPFVDPELPSPGGTWVYLATLRGLTFEGTLGQDSTGQTRMKNSFVCP